MKERMGKDGWVASCGDGDTGGRREGERMAKKRRVDEGGMVFSSFRDARKEERGEKEERKQETATQARNARLPISRWPVEAGLA